MVLGVIARTIAFGLLFTGFREVHEAAADLTAKVLTLTPAAFYDGRSDLLRDVDVSVTIEVHSHNIGVTIAVDVHRIGVNVAIVISVHPDEVCAAVVVGVSHDHVDTPITIRVGGGKIDCSIFVSVGVHVIRLPVVIKIGDNEVHDAVLVDIEDFGVGHSVAIRIHIRSIDHSVVIAILGSYHLRPPGSWRGDVRRHARSFCRLDDGCGNGNTADGHRDVFHRHGLGGIISVRGH